MLFFFNDTATTEIYTLSLHDALPISGSDLLPRRAAVRRLPRLVPALARRASRLLPLLPRPERRVGGDARDWKSTRLNFSHANISFAVFWLKKKNIITYSFTQRPLYFI